MVNPGSIFHSNSIGSPSMRFKFSNDYSRNTVQFSPSKLRSDSLLYHPVGEDVLAFEI